MHAKSNPYASALDGLVLDDPVRAFFDFCRAREAIRHLRESGAPAPWTTDPILSKGRFLNIFREDDRGSKAVLRFAKPLTDDLPSLIQAVFFARWCNRQATLDTLQPTQLSDPLGLKNALLAMPSQPWCNVTAYPVGPVHWEGQLHSRVDSATVLFSEIKDTLTQLIVEAKGSVVTATQSINARFMMDNDFPIFMAVMDLAWFRPDIIDPQSPVPTGIGAIAFLDRLQAHLGLNNHHETCDAMIALQPEHWPEAKRGFAPIDIEYLSCECRKYYSYVNGTKQFTGKNCFEPGESARLEFDIEEVPTGAPVVQTQIHVIAGGPCSGKTTVIQALQDRGHTVVPETARTLLEQGVAAGQTAEALRADPALWQQKILELDHQLFDGLPEDETIFTDTSFIEDVVFGQRAGIRLGAHTQTWLQQKRYRTVFFLEPLKNYEEGGIRIETQDVASQISGEVYAQYLAFGYTPILVPAGTVEERVSRIQSEINQY